MNFCFVSIVLNLKFINRLDGKNFYTVFRRVKKLIDDVKNELVLVHLDLDSPESVLYVPIVLAIISEKNNNAFYFVAKKEEISAESDRLGCRVIITADPCHHDVLHENKIIVDIQDKPASKIPEDTVYVIKTSGSTGAAKTVYVTNSSVVPNIIDMASELGVSSKDVILLSSPPTFDPHIIDVFLCAYANATLLIRPRQQLQSGDVELETVTILHCTPSLLLRVSSSPRLRVVNILKELKD